MSLESFIRAMPKAELHIHLEGSIRPHTLLALAERNGVTLPFSDEAGLQAYYQFTDFPHFIEVWYTINEALQTVDDFRLITYELGKEAGQQNVRYMEVTFTPTTTVRRLGVSYDDLLAAINVGAAQAEAEYGVIMRWINDFDRGYAGEDVAGKTLAWAAAAQDRGVVALGMGGNEKAGPPDDFVTSFYGAYQAGLHRIPHQGEYEGADSVWAAIRLLQAERIGHGIRAAEDVELMAYLAQEQIALEISPTSNVCTRVVADLQQHPIRKLHAAGVPITLNTDDPAMFNTTLTDEYLLAAREFGFGASELAGFSQNAIRYSFLPDEQKGRLLAQFTGEIARLMEQHL